MLERKNWILVLFAAFLMVLCSSSTAMACFDDEGELTGKEDERVNQQAENLVQNEFFEDWDGGMPMNWHSENYADSNYQQNGSEAFYGEYSVYIEENHTDPFTLAQNLSLEQGVNYYQEVWVKGSGEARVGMKYPSPSGYTGYGDWVSANSTEWTNATYEQDPTETGDDGQIRIQVDNAENGLWIGAAWMAENGTHPPENWTDRPHFGVNVLDHNETVVEGEEFSVDYNVTNGGEVEGTQDVNIGVYDEGGGLVYDDLEENITLAPGDEHQGSFTWPTQEGDAGNYSAEVSSEDDKDEVNVTVLSEGASFFVEMINYDEEVEEGDPVTVSYEVNNTGNLEDTQTIEFTVEDALEGSEEVTLAPSETYNGSFTWNTSAEDVGENILEVASADDSAQVTVTVSEAVGDPENLVQNEFFEDWESGMPVSWHSEDYADSNYQQNGSEAFYGEYSVYIEENYTDPFTLAQNLSLEQGVDYYQEVWVKGSGEARVGMKYPSGSGYTTYGDWVSATTTEWTNATYEQDPTETGDDGQIRIQVDNAENGLWIGAAWMAEGGAQPPENWTERPYFEVDVLNYNETLIEGDELSVDYNVTNGGEVEGTQDVEFAVFDDGGSLVHQDMEENVTLVPGEEHIGSFNWTTQPGDEGTYTVEISSEDDKAEFDLTVLSEEASFIVEITGYDQEVEEGEPVFIGFAVENMGGGEDTQTVEFTVDSEVIDSENITLGPDETSEGNFTWQTEQGDAGEHVLNVSSEDHTDGVTVSVLDTLPETGNLLQNEFFEDWIDMEDPEYWQLDTRAQRSSSGEGMVGEYALQLGPHDYKGPYSEYQAVTHEEANGTEVTYHSEVWVKGTGYVRLGILRPGYGMRDYSDWYAVDTDEWTNISYQTTKDTRDGAEGEFVIQHTADSGEAGDDSDQIDEVDLMVGAAWLGAEEPEEGWTEVPYFDVDVIDYDEQVVEGNEANVDYRVNNSGEAEDTQTVEITVNDSLEYSEEITLGPGEVYEDDFTWTPDGTGDYIVRIESEDDAEEVIISVVEEIQEYDLTIDAGEGGTTDPEPGNYTYEEGENVTVTALPDEDWRFSRWEGDVPQSEEESDEITITMGTDKTLEARFEEETVVMYELTVESTEGGNVTEPGEGTFEYEEGETVDLEAVADEGYEFMGWTGEVMDVEDTRSAQTTLEMNDDYTITAEFEEVELYTLDIDVEGEGTVEVKVDGEVAAEVRDEWTGYFQEDTEVTLTAEPGDDWSFEGWTGTSGDGDDETMEITLNEDKEMTAVFEEETTTGNWWMIGIAAAVIVLVAAIVIGILKKRSSAEEETSEEELFQDMMDEESDLQESEGPETEEEAPPEELDPFEEEELEEDNKGDEQEDEDQELDIDDLEI
ncbi:MAG: InlB B-repeat-containing protein [Candidatus Natronoplasma sp.]